jgi:hypothetical protein
MTAEASIHWAPSYIGTQIHVGTYVRAYESDGHFLILRRYVSDIPRVEKYIRSVQPECTSVRCVATEVASFRTRKMRYMRREPGGKPRADEMIQ